MATLPRNTQVQVVGRNVDNTWWKINYNGIIGWVSAAFAPLPAGTNINLIPLAS